MQFLKKFMQNSSFLTKKLAFFRFLVYNTGQATVNTSGVILLPLPEIIR